MATTNLLSAAESWEKIYSAFDQVNFTAYDYDAVKQSLLDYLKLQYPENFNDYIESSQFIALIETFAYVAELLAYRVDLSIHESLMPTATRKQSILRLAKLISYTASRNLPLRGLVKITSISTSENLTDSQGNSLTNRIILWNDPNNSLWREQFFAVMNKVLTQSYGNPFKSFQIYDTIFQQYEIKNILETVASNSAFNNGVIKSSVNINGQDLPFELVPSDIDQSGVFERNPNPNSYFTILYADDGYGDSSYTTGFMMYVKQGTLQKLTKVFNINLPNQTVDVNVPNINNSDVWVQQVDPLGVITNTWQSVPNVAGVNLIFNGIQNQLKYEIETLENDQIRLIFGDGDFAAMPSGIFNIWVRSSASGGLSVPQSAIVDSEMTFGYTSKMGSSESCTFTYSLAAPLQNSAATEDVNHIKSVAPSVYYSQNRMVNGSDYNSYLLQDPSILRLYAVNRTFAGQPKYIDWNDASGAYQNIKIFGDDLRMYYDMTALSEISTISTRSLIDDVFEPALSLPEVYSMLIYAFYKTPYSLSYINASSVPTTISIRPYIKPRLKFIEDINQGIQEKTLIQGYLDRHWYGEPDSIVSLDSNLSDTSSLNKTSYAVVNGDTDHVIWNSNIKCVLQDNTTGLYTLIPTPNGISGIQETIMRQKRFGISFNPIRNFVSINLQMAAYGTPDSAFPNPPLITSSMINQAVITEDDVYTIEITDTSGTFSVHSVNRGYQAPGIVGESYTDGIFSFILGPSTAEIVVGDAFIISINKDFSGRFTPQPAILANLTGVFGLIDDATLSSVDAVSLDYDPLDPIASWIFIVERTDDSSGNTQYNTIIRRSFKLIVESLTTNFWYNQNTQIVDPTTQLPVVDLVKILKSNLDVTGTVAIGTDQVYNVVSNVLHNNGQTNYAALAITPSNVLTTVTTAAAGAIQDPIEYLSFVGDNNYVYFSIDQATGNRIPIEATVYLENLTYINDVTVDNLYARTLGRDNLDFLWQHFTPNNNLIDPSVSNIIDIYVLTSNYYSQVLEYVNGFLPIEPTPPSPLDLRNSYRALLENKMISDTVIMHSGTVKFIFGSLAVPELRTMFKVLLSPNATLTGDQVRAAVLNTINQYFVIDNWDFGQSFYATELCAVIHKQLSTEISSVVMVPQFPTNYFGDLFYLKSSPSEIFVSCATIDNIEIVSSIDRKTLKQKQ
jgi:hypothetical protein